MTWDGSAEEVTTRHWAKSAVLGAGTPNTRRAGAEGGHRAVRNTFRTGILAPYSRLEIDAFWLTSDADCGRIGPATCTGCVYFVLHRM